MFPLRVHPSRRPADFRRDDRGTLAVVFACTMSVLGLAVGGAVDYGVALKVQSRLDGAVDAASLAGAKLYVSGITDTKRIADEATRNFEANYAAEAARGFSAATPTVVTDPAKGRVSVTTTATVPTAFLTVFGFDSITVRSTSSSQLDADTIELSMMLDTTGSMDEYTTDGKVKIAALRTAATDLVDKVYASAPSGSSRVKVALAPFAAGVNAGAYARTVSANKSTACVMERADLTTADSDASATAARLRAATTCPTTAVVPLTTDSAAVRAAIKGLKTGGTTAGHLGASWAYWLLSPRWRDVFGADHTGAAFGAPETRKIAILMTDGKFNTFLGSMSGVNEARSANAALAVCDAMKADGVTVYTVGFALAGEPAAKDTLRACASEIAGAPAFYDAEDAAALTAAYADITRRILTLRLSS
ncbi:TadE/TadG family type IV pilus assembly protein [Oharaeibacter diazotrophicus]|uniref:Flp pilus assembly protein TadG n=1 Tax=Oharaeibacter diazotrophicus TaxID=1920512 RepID=A0A4R6RCZ7_9HYPH|nr:pilus assembly protein [Oharaeibacter diazotrophicus]TDP84043.1 Flp pilus assembly protein TadG [Oharaeibacter diazotrophicus]BBE73082.1 hypothetical protein OHA_1_02688 [Pleomorphomonas sp. SM30]GLS74871.1 hypothetical protein GCM10007904_02060 [Oharaeibacter diazotrophicus]